MNKLKNADGHAAGNGMNPFSAFEVNGVPMTQRVKCHTPSRASSGVAYNDISENIEDWIEDAIDTR